MNMKTRIPPFGNLDDFSTTPKTEPELIDARLIDLISAEAGFPSRPLIDSVEPLRPHRYTTGRTKQINVKATAATVELFHVIAAEMQIPLSDVFSRAILAFNAARK